MELTHCALCPRSCGTDRTKRQGFCGAGEKIRVARAALHHWEEPPLSGTSGSGTVFFSGCPMRCCFCQNYDISAGNYGIEISIDRLSEIFLELQQQGAHNINLVNPGHYAVQVAAALRQIAGQLQIPVVFNSGGYEKVETLRLLEGLIQIYLPDIKYKSDVLARRYSSAPAYFTIATAAVKEMYRQVGAYQENKQGIMEKGLIIRHLILPGARKDSMEILDWVASHLPKEQVRISLMRQYTPFYRAAYYPEINRRLTTLEYESVRQKALGLGLIGFSQEKSSAREEYTPPFDLEGVEKKT